MIRISCYAKPTARFATFHCLSFLFLFLVHLFLFCFFFHSFYSASSFILSDSPHPLIFSVFRFILLSLDFFLLCPAGACMRARARARVCVCERERVFVCVLVCVCVRERENARSVGRSLSLSLSLSLSVPPPPPPPSPPPPHPLFHFSQQSLCPTRAVYSRDLLWGTGKVSTGNS